MEIEKIYTLPTLERNEDESGYEYPKNMQNKIYNLNNIQYILIEKNTIQSIPIKFVEYITSSIIQKIEENQSKLYDDNSFKILEEKFEQKINEYLSPIRKIIENINDKLAEKIEITDLQNFRDEINNAVNNALEIFNSQNETENPALEKSTVNFDIKKIEEIIKTEFDKLFEIKNKNILKEFKEILFTELNIVKSNLEPMIKNIINNIKSELNIQQINHINQDKEPINLTKLVALKELGFDINELFELKKQGLLTW